MAMLCHNVSERKQSKADKTYQPGNGVMPPDLLVRVHEELFQPPDRDYRVPDCFPRLRMGVKKTIESQLLPVFVEMCWCRIITNESIVLFKDHQAFPSAIERIPGSRQVNLATGDSNRRSWFEVVGHEKSTGRGAFRSQFPITKPVGFPLGSYQTRDYKSHSSSRNPPADRRSDLSSERPGFEAR